MTFRQRPEVLNELQRLLGREQLADPSWILTLDEFDEPPLFPRFADADFLRGLPPQERTLAVLDFVVRQLDRFQDVVRRTPAQTAVDLFACVTFDWWDQVETGEVATACPSFLVVPRHSQQHDPNVPFHPARTTRGQIIQLSLTLIGRDKEVMAAEVTPDPRGRVYVGYSGRPTSGLLSVGDFLSAPHNVTPLYRPACAVPAFENWTFRVTEISNGVYCAIGIGPRGLRVESTDTDPEKVLADCREFALRHPE